MAIISLLTEEFNKDNFDYFSWVVIKNFAKVFRFSFFFEKSVKI